MSETEQEILSRCRATGLGGWVMREFQGRAMVVSLRESEPTPNGRAWERRDKRIAEGADWAEVLAILDARP